VIIRCVPRLAVQCVTGLGVPRCGGVFERIAVNEGIEFARGNQFVTTFFY
jgi:hypothetical protein